LTTAVQALCQACIVIEGFKSEWHHIACATLATVYHGFRFLAREQVSSTQQSQRRCFFSDKVHFLRVPLHLPLERRRILHPAFLVYISAFNIWHRHTRSCNLLVGTLPPPNPLSLPPNAHSLPPNPLSLPPNAHSLPPNPLSLPPNPHSLRKKLSDFQASKAIWIVFVSVRTIKMYHHHQLLISLCHSSHSSHVPTHKKRAAVTSLGHRR
jgi:hypothetical protein